MPQETLIQLDDELRRTEEADLLHACIGIEDSLNLVGYFRGEFGLAESVRTMAITCNTVEIKVNIQDTGLKLDGRQNNRTMDRFITSNNNQRTHFFM